MILHVHEDCTDALNRIKLANDFVSGLEHGMTIFGKFNSVDLVDKIPSWPVILLTI